MRQQNQRQQLPNNVPQYLYGSILRSVRYIITGLTTDDGPMMAVRLRVGFFQAGLSRVSVKVTSLFNLRYKS